MKIRPLHTALLASALVGVAMIPVVRRIRQRNAASLGHDGKPKEPGAAPKSLRSSTSDRLEAAPKLANTPAPH